MSQERNQKDVAGSVRGLIWTSGYFPKKIYEVQETLMGFGRTLKIESRFPWNARTHLSSYMVSPPRMQ
jgi:hypothetical protein